MKKIIIALFLIFVSTLTVFGADNLDEEVVLKEIKITNFELAPFEGDLEVDYELVPNDVENKEIVWSISGLQTGVTAEIVDSYKTDKAVGTITLKVKNENDKTSSFNLNAKSGNITKSVKVEIETQELTEERYKKEVVENIEKLIEEVKDIDSKNEKEIEKAINKIEIMLKNEEVKSSVKESLLEDFDGIKKDFEAYKNEEENDTTKIIVIAALVLAFLFGLYMIFKDNSKTTSKKTKAKEEKKAPVKEAKIEPKKLDKKQNKNKKK